MVARAALPPLRAEVANQPRGRFATLLAAGAALLAAALCAAAALDAPWSWIVGLLYIAYDTWLLLTLVSSSRQAVADEFPAMRANAPRPTLAVLIAARNERLVLPRTLDAVLAQDDVPEEIVVVDDGSSDGTRAFLERSFAVRFLRDGSGRSELVPSLLVLSRPNAGKASSLNEAVALAKSDVVVTLDADTRLAPGALRAIRAAFQAEPELAAACGVLRPECRPGWSSRFFELYQTFEYLRSFLWRLAWMREDTLVLVSGAFAAFRREQVTAAGGFDPACRVEDYELMFRLHRRSLERGRPLRVRVVSDARAVTDAPGRPLNFLRQRTRWFAGFLETMFRNHDMVGNAAYGRLGTFHLLVKTADTLLPVYAFSASATLVLLLLGRGVDRVILAVLAAKFCLDFACHAYCLFLHERWQRRRMTLRLFLRAALASLTEPYLFQIFRQIGALLGWVAFLRGNIDWAPQRPAALRPPEHPR
jgi:cellulose synthase/poly-beta-1,6-N-acetylglucosamine synthase-like glycosyltransferase